MELFCCENAWHWVTLDGGDGMGLWHGGGRGVAAGGGGGLREGTL